jgi:hypothetical protein
MPQQPSHQYHYSQMRRMQQSVFAPSRRWPHRIELKFAPLVRGDPAKSRGNFLASRARFLIAVTKCGLAGLPDFQHRIRHGLAIAIKNPPAN